MADEKFVDTPMKGFDAPDPKTKPSPGEYDGIKTGPFGEYKRTPSPNAVPEKVLDGKFPGKPTGEDDQFK